MPLLGLTSRRFRSGSPLDLKKEAKVQWLLALKRDDPDRFAEYPDDQQDVTDVGRGLLFQLYHDMIAAGLYAKPQGPTKGHERLLGLRGLIGEARARR